MNRNLTLLTISQVFGFTTATITIFLSGIVGSQITSVKLLSTLPTALFVVGTASCTILAAKIMSKIGRRNGFVLAATLSSITSLLAAFSISEQNFTLFCISCTILGMGTAFNHQYRFAAAESVSKEQIPKAVSILMLAGIVSAFIGITSANYTKDIVTDYMYVGSYLLLSLFTFMPAIFLFFYKNVVNENIETSKNVLKIIKDELVIKREMTIILIAHHFTFIEPHCDKILEFTDGLITNIN